MRTREFNEEVLFATDPIVRIGARDIEYLKQRAKCNKRRRVRVCAHGGHEDKIHEMFIVHEKGCYVQPHKHINKTESFHIIEGAVDIVLFEEEGRINGTISMGDYSTGRPFFYRLPPSIYHTLSISSDFLVFHEITKGPFKPSDTVWAPWAPEEAEKEAVSRYIEIIANFTKEKDQYG